MATKTATPSTARSGSSAALNRARAGLQTRLDFEAFLAKLKSAKERTNAQQHLDTTRADGDPRHAKLWERLVNALLTLAPELPRFGGQRAVQFSVPDGRYKLQVFAMQDGEKGEIYVYTQDVSVAARDAGLLRTGKAAGDRTYLSAQGGEMLVVDEVADTGGEQKLPEFVRPMLGWGKKALRITVPPNATEPQIAAVEDLCALAALQWRGK
jgi:hypothetical protein